MPTVCPMLTAAHRRSPSRSQDSNYELSRVSNNRSFENGCFANEPLIGWHSKPSRNDEQDGLNCGLNFSLFGSSNSFVVVIDCELDEVADWHRVGEIHQSACLIHSGPTTNWSSSKT